MSRAAEDLAFVIPPSHSARNCGDQTRAQPPARPLHRRRLAPRSGGGSVGHLCDRPRAPSARTSSRASPDWWTVGLGGSATREEGRRVGAALSLSNWRRWPDGRRAGSSDAMGLPPSRGSALPSIVRSRVPARGGLGVIVCTLTGGVLAAAAASAAFQDLFGSGPAGRTHPRVLCRCVHGSRP